MRTPSLCLSLIVLAACGGGEKPAADTAAAPAPAAEPAAAPAPAAFDLKAAAGTWEVKAMKAGTDSVLLTYEVTATADTTGWTVAFPGRPAIPMKVSVSGDSVITDVGPYDSALRKGVKVTTHGSLHMNGGELTGHNTAHYQNAGPDSVLQLTAKGTKKP